MLRRLIMVLVVMKLAVLALATTSQATGFRIAAHGAKALGMGGAFAAQADDPAAIYYNPAGITQLDGTQAQGGFLFIYTTGTEYEPLPGQISLLPDSVTPTAASSADIDGKLFTLPTLFGTRKIGERTSIGLGIYVPFGLTIDWPDDWDGRNISTLSAIETTYVNFVVAHDILPWWSVSAGLAYARSEAELSRTSYALGGALIGAGQEAFLHFEGQGWTMTYDVGTQVRLGERVKLGAAYRHQAVIEHSGNVDIHSDPGGPQILPSIAATAKVPLPSTFVVGVAVKPTDWWTIEADWDFTHWSSFQDLTLHTPSMPAIEQGLAILSPFPNRKWKDTSIYRVGTEFQVSEPLAIRLGYAYIETPIPDETLDPILPDADRTSLTAGFGYKITPSLTLDVAYEYQHFHERTKNNGVLVDPGLGLPDGLRANGTYNTDAHVVVTQLKYVF